MADIVLNSIVNDGYITTGASFDGVSVVIPADNGVSPIRKSRTVVTNTTVSNQELHVVDALTVTADYTLNGQTVTFGGKVLGSGKIVGSGKIT